MLAASAAAAASSAASSIAGASKAGGTGTDGRGVRNRTGRVVVGDGRRRVGRLGRGGLVAAAREQRGDLVALEQEGGGRSGDAAADQQGLRARSAACAAGRREVERRGGRARTRARRRRRRALRAVLARFITKTATHTSRKQRTAAAKASGRLQRRWCYAAGEGVGSSNGASAAARFSSRTACQISSR